MAETKTYGDKNRNNQFQTDIGKLPPQAIEIEEAVIGALLLDKDAIINVMDLLKPESFYNESHKKIYNAILELGKNQKPVDLLTVTEQLRTTNELDDVGGPYYITQLSGKVASSANIEFHARIVAQKYIQRELIKASSEIQKEAYDETLDVKDLLDNAENRVFKIAEGNIKKSYSKISEVVSEAIHQIEEASKREDGLSGVPTGFSKLDTLTSGWQMSDLIIIAARPSMGKTAFVLSMARNMTVDYKKPVAFFSLEMPSVQLVNRLLVGETEIDSNKIRNGRLSHDEWALLEKKSSILIDAPMYIDDTPGLSIYEFRSKCRRLKEEADIQCVIIDYLQLMTGPNDTRSNREQEVSIISRSLKGVAKELNVPIIALSQLNRSVETRAGDKKPQLSDLRESGAIEQDADIVCFIHRPEYYNITEDSENNSLIGIGEIIVAKHRNGGLGDIRLRFRKEQAKFTDLEELSGLPPYTPDNSGDGSVTYGSKMNEDDSNSTKLQSPDPLSVPPNTDFENEGGDAPF